MQALWPTLLLTALYLIVVWKGPKYMANRPPMQLKYTLFVYNALLVIMNFHISYEVRPHTYCFFHTDFTNLIILP